MRSSTTPKIFVSDSDTILSGVDTIMVSGPGATHPVARRRMARDWTQAELARRAGVSRAAVSAIEGFRLSPSVASALALARVLGCTVEDLFGADGADSAAGPAWAWEPWPDSCRYWEAEVFGRCLRYPLEGMALNPLPQDGIFREGGYHENRRSDARGTLTVATCDPAVGWLARAYERETGFRMLVFPRGGGAALDLVRRRLIHVGAVHRSTGEYPDRNKDSVRAALGGEGCLLRAARWESGLAHAAGGRARSAGALSRRVRQWASRESGSAARECLDTLLGGKTPAGRVVDSHAGVTEAVRAGWAEAGVCVKLCAVEARLPFVPLQRETLDFFFHAGLAGDPRIEGLLRVVRGPAYRKLLEELPGYDARETGEFSHV